MRACVASADADRDALRRALRRSVEASLKEATRIIQETGHIVDKLSQGHEPKDGQDQDLREIDQLKDNLKVAREEAADSQKQISRLKDELATCKFRLSEMNVRANEEVQKEKEVTRDALERLDMLELKLREAKEEAKQCRDALNKQEQTMDLVVGRLAEARHDLHKSRSASEDVKRLESPGTEANKISTCRESIWAGSLQPRRDLYRSASPASGGRPTIAFARVGEPAVSAAGLQHSMDVNRIDSLAGGGWPTIACTGVGESTSLDGSLQQRLDLIRTGSPAGGLRPITACTHVGEAVVSASSWQRRMDANKTNSPASGGRPTIACTHAGEPAVLDSSLPYRMDVNQTDSYAREGWPRIDPTRVGEPSQAVRPVDVISITSQPSGDERTVRAMYSTKPCLFCIP